MTGYNKAATLNRPPAMTSSPIVTNHQGGTGYLRDAKTELFLLAVNTLAGEDTHYESAADREQRLRSVVHDVAVTDHDWIGRFIPWLRNEANLRSVTIAVACEAVWARINRGHRGGNRALISAACQRADEPGEILAYWISRYGRSIPQAVKRGVADAVARLYTERSFLKYDSDRRDVRFADVIELVHPTPDPEKPWQGALFEYILANRHGRTPAFTELKTINRHRHLMAVPKLARRAMLTTNANGTTGPEYLAEAGITWEALASWLQEPLDRRAWEAIAPRMGYEALLKNLRNMDIAGVGGVAAAQIAERLADPAEVEKSRQLPLRFLAAHRATSYSHRWSFALESALNQSLRNIPQLDGRTLILVDTSTSMNAKFSKDGTLQRWDAATTFGVALASRCYGADVVSFAGKSFSNFLGLNGRAQTKQFPFTPGESLLRALDRWKDGGYFLGGGTETAAALREHYRNHDRVVILTDEQTGQDPIGVDQSIPSSTPLYTFNLAGYKPSHNQAGRKNRYAFGGLTDHMFRAIPMLEAGERASWPF